jgi:hypothetical protein
MFILSESSVTELIEYLLFHEDDIAYGINDFSGLRGVFVWLIGRAPEKEFDCGKAELEAVKVSNYICEQLKGLEDKK